MPRRLFRSPAVLAVMALALAACSAPRAYVDYPVEQTADLQPVKDPETGQYRVAICYSSQFDTPAQVKELARAECAKIKLKPRFLGQDMLACPVLLPVRAHYACE